MKKKIILIITVIISLFTAVLGITCSSSPKNDDTVVQLIQYYIRVCVIETGDPELCDTRCKCAAEKLQEGLNDKQFSELVSAITSETTNRPKLKGELASAIG